MSEAGGGGLPLGDRGNASRDERIRGGCEKV